MPEAKLFAGYVIRRLRRQQGRSQVDMATELGISPSYLNLVERNQRPVTATLLFKLYEVFGVDLRALTAEEPGGGREAMRRRLSDPMFADLGVDREELQAWLEAAPAGVEAFARLYDQLSQSAGGIGSVAMEEAGSVALVRREIERWRNHFADLEASAELLADELRLGGGDLYAAIGDRLRVRHQLSVRILPVDVMPDHLRRLDLHARQLQLSELLDQASRCFQAAFQLAQLEAKAEIDALVAGGDFPDRSAELLFRRHLTSYFSAALMMPYSRFLRACEATSYDLELLSRRFAVGFEMLAHRLTTLQRVGERGLPFFMIRIDRAGQVSKRYAGDSGSPLVEGAARCPLWRVHSAFEQPGSIIRQLVALEDGQRWFTLARTVTPHGRGPQGISAQFAIGLGVDARHAGALAYARGIDLDVGEATPIGPGCLNCLRPNCPQRSTPALGRALVLDERERAFTPFTFAKP